MNLHNCILRPGRVLEINKNNPGQIKIEAPGLFSKQHIQQLPWVYPFFTGHTNQFSKPIVNQEVWVLNNKENPSQLYWFLKNEDQFKEIEKFEEITKDTNVECVVHREVGSGWATLYFSDGQGWIIRHNSDSIIQIRKDGSILLENPNETNRSIDICNNSISLGKKGGSDHPASLGDKVQECFDLIQQCLKTVKQAAAGNAYTSNIATAIGSFPDKLKNKIPETLSKEVTLQ